MHTPSSKVLPKLYTLKKNNCENILLRYVIEEKYKCNFTSYSNHITFVELLN